MISGRAAAHSVEQVSAILASHHEARVPLAIEGGGTLRSVGSAPRAQSVLSLEKFDALHAHDYHDLTCAVGAGMTLAVFSAKLAEHGQFVPLDAPLRRKATVGGTMASGWPGPRRHYYGRLRDAAIGSVAILADGSVVSAGGMVVKNVTGYDMTKLYTGSFGTLAVLTRCNFKTLPLPAAKRALLVRLPERTRDRAIAQMQTVRPAPAAAICVEGYRKAIDGDDGIDGRMVVLLEGTRSLIERATREIRSALGRAGVPETAVVDGGAEQILERVVDAPISTLGERSLTYRSLGLPETSPERARLLRDAANARQMYTDVLLDVMNGDVYVRASDRDARAFAGKIEAYDDAARAIDPRRIIVAGAAPIRSSLDSWGEPAPAIEKMREIKRRFDPHGILNPGRFAGGI